MKRCGISIDFYPFWWALGYMFYERSVLIAIGPFAIGIYLP